MNLPNKITLSRIFLIPVFMVLLLSKMPYGDILSAVVFIIAASTDGVDGYLARKNHQVTNLGKLLDPLADKMLVCSALVSLVQIGNIPAWVVMVILAREFFITGLRGIAAAEGVVIAASIWGKVKTVTQIIAICVILLEKYLNFLEGIPLGSIMLGIAVFFTVLSGTDYVIKAFKVIDMENEK